MDGARLGAARNISRAPPPNPPTQKRTLMVKGGNAEWQNPPENSCSDKSFRIVYIELQPLLCGDG